MKNTRYFLKTVLPICFLLGCCYGAVKAQDTIAEPNFIPIVAYWSRGDTFQYELIKGVKTYKDGVLSDSVATTKTMTLVVADSTDSTYVVRVFIDYDLEDVRKASIKAGVSVGDLTQIASSLGCFNLEYETDEYGTFLHLRNLDKLYNVYLLTLERVVEQKKKDMTPEMQKQYMDLIEPRKSLTFFTGLFLEEIKLMHKFYGNSYAQDSIWRFDAVVPNPYKPEVSVKFTNTILVRIPEDADDFVLLKNHIVIDSDLHLSMLNYNADDRILEKINQEYALNTPRTECFVNSVFFRYSGVLEYLYFENNSFVKDDLISQKFTTLTLKN